MTSGDDDGSMARWPNTGVFLARVWREDDGAFRARVTYHVNINSDADPEAQVVTGDPDHLHLLLTSWLAASAAAEQ